MILEDLAKRIGTMTHSKLSNYIVAGLHSQLVGGKDGSKVRLFSADRDTRDSITPHSHRFNFTCLVLTGEVENTVYNRTDNSLYGDLYCKSFVDQVCGVDGLLKYTHIRQLTPLRYETQTTVYGVGEVYGMAHHVIHSITFKKGTQVLFFEGPQMATRGEMLEPWVNGKCVLTFKTEDWMFEKVLQ